MLSNDDKEFLKQHGFTGDFELESMLEWAHKRILEIRGERPDDFTNSQLSAGFYLWRFSNGNYRSEIEGEIRLEMESDPDPKVAVVKLLMAVLPPPKGTNQ